MPLLVVLHEVALLEVLPELVEPSGKGLWKGLLGTGLSWKGLQEWKQLPPEVMVLEGGVLLPGLLWMVFIEGLLRMTSYTGLLVTLWVGSLVRAGWLVGAGAVSSAGSSYMSSQSGRQYADGGPSGWTVVGSWDTSGSKVAGSRGTSMAAGGWLGAFSPKGGKGKKSPRCRSPHCTWCVTQSWFSPAL